MDYYLCVCMQLLDNRFTPLLVLRHSNSALRCTGTESTPVPMTPFVPNTHDLPRRAASSMGVTITRPANDPSTVAVRSRPPASPASVTVAMRGERGGAHAVEGVVSSSPADAAQHVTRVR